MPLADQAIAQVCGQQDQYVQQTKLEPKKRVIMCLPQVEPDLTSTLKLTVAFKCTNAFSAWQRLNLAESNMGHGTSELWLHLAEILATECGWSLLEMDNQLDAFVSVAPLDALPDAMMNDSTRRIYWWESVSKPSRPLMLLLDTYMHALGMHHLDDDPKTAAMQSVTSCTNYIRSRQPSGKPSDRDLLMSLVPAGYITYLRSALLLIKLISILSSLPSEDNEVVFQSTELLCSALTTLCSKMQGMDNASSGTLEFVGFSLEDSHLYVQKLSVLVLQLALPVFKQLIKTSKETASVGAICCCSVFHALHPINRLNRHKTIAVKLAGSGALGLLSLCALLATLSNPRSDTCLCQIWVLLRCALLANLIS